MSIRARTQGGQQFRTTPLHIRRGNLAAQYSWESETYGINLLYRGMSQSFDTIYYLWTLIEISRVVSCLMPLSEWSREQGYSSVHLYCLAALYLLSQV